MIRVTPEQYSLLREKAEGKATLAKQQRVRKRKDDLPENQVERQITDYLGLYGWTCTKQHAGTAYRRLSTQVMFSVPKGQADWRAERPIIPKGERTGPASFLCWYRTRYGAHAGEPPTEGRPMKRPTHGTP
jgi:hypothetical protein